jgi:hypothetical protein
VYGVAITEPQPWPAGECGGEPIYLDCAGSCCTTPSPAPIAGFLSSSPGYEFGAMIVLPTPDGVTFRLAVYCAGCWALVRESLADDEQREGVMPN